MHILAIILDSLQSNSPITSPPSGYRKKKRNIGQHSSLSSMLNVVFLVIRHCLSGIMSIKWKGILKVYFNCHNLNGIKLITRLRLSLSDLHDHKFKSSRLHQRNWYRNLVIIFYNADLEKSIKFVKNPKLHNQSTILHHRKIYFFLIPPIRKYEVNTFNQRTLCDIETCFIRYHFF